MVETFDKMTEGEPPNPDVLSNPGPNVLPMGFDCRDM